MRTRIGLTKIDVAIALACVAFGIASVGAIGKAGRERAKRAVCMDNLRALTAAWAMYSDDNGGILVNASAGFDKDASGGYMGNRTWPCWVDAWNLIISMQQGQTERAEQLLRDPCDVRVIGEQRGRVQEIRGTNLLYRYCGNLKFFKCPAVEPGEVLTYSIVDAMAGAATWQFSGQSDLGPPFFRRSEILHPSKRFVFVDEGRATIDSWTLYYNQPRWWDPPPGHHNVGGTFSFADGHAEYHKWKTEEVIELCGLSWWEASMYMDGTDWTCNEDLEWVQIHAWGRLGYDPQALGCP